MRDGNDGLEVFCVERSKQSRFVGGAIVFPGGKLDPSDYDEAWAPLTTDPRETTAGHSEPFTKDAAHLRALAIAACRETLEEATLLFVHGAKKPTDAELLALREKLTTEPGALRAFLTEHGLKLDLGALHAFARWTTPTAEARRFDTRFFLSVAPAENLSPICPRIVPTGDAVAIVLPGDPEHDVRESRVPGPSRFVKRGDQWLPSDG